MGAEVGCTWSDPGRSRLFSGSFRPCRPARGAARAPAAHGNAWEGPGVSDRAERIAWFKAGVLPHEASLRRFLRRTGAPDMDLDDLVSEALMRTYAAEDWS